MSQSDRELESLLAPLRDGPVALSGSGAANAQRERMLPRVRAQVEHVPSRLRRARIVRRSWAAGGALVALSAIALGVVTVQRTGQAPAPHAEPLRIEPGSAAMAWIDAAGTRREIRGALTLESPGELVGARDAWSHVSTARGVQLELAPRARLRVSAAPQITDSKPVRGSSAAAEASAGLSLLQGEVHCRVPKLGKRKQFSIATPDAQVIVHGTVFSVAVRDADNKPTTCVRVDEGLVEVRSAGSSVFLGPSMQWGCDRAAPPSATSKASERSAPHTSATASRATASVAQSRASVAQRRVLRGRTQSLAAEGTLDEENRLLASALAAERDGELTQARRLFALLLARHPSSPLVPEARLGLVRAR